MLQKQTVEKNTLDILNKLMQDESLNDFILVGGTALSLHIGHRKSIDLDLFTQKDFDTNAVEEHLYSNFQFQTSYKARNTLKGSIDGVKVDLIAHKYPYIMPPLTMDGIRIADIKDITAMKLNAIAGDGSRLKDFVDIAFLSRHLSLQQMIACYSQKYSGSNAMIIPKALLYYEDIIHDEPIVLFTKNYKFQKLTIRLNEMVKYPEKIFPVVFKE